MMRHRARMAQFSGTVSTSRSVAHSRRRTESAPWPRPPAPPSAWMRMASPTALPARREVTTSLVRKARATVTSGGSRETTPRLGPRASGEKATAAAV